VPVLIALLLGSFEPVTRHCVTGAGVYMAGTTAARSVDGRRLDGVLRHRHTHGLYCRSNCTIPPHGTPTSCYTGCPSYLHAAQSPKLTTTSKLN